LTGNQLAVFTDGRDVEEETMQRLAKEMNFSETVFVLPPEADGHARIRIFTRALELPFAGHPVLGSAFVLGAPLQLGEIRLPARARTNPDKARGGGAATHCGVGGAAGPRARAVRRRRRIATGARGPVATAGGD